MYIGVGGKRQCLKETARDLSDMEQGMVVGGSWVAGDKKAGKRDKGEKLVADLAPVNSGKRSETFEKAVKIYEALCPWCQAGRLCKFVGKKVSRRVKGNGRDKAIQTDS